MIVYGSAFPGANFGRAVANAASLTSEGADVTGLLIGSIGLGDPVWMGTTNQDGLKEMRLYLRGNYKLLSDNTIATFHNLSVATGTIACVEIHWTVWVFASGAIQQKQGITLVNVINRTGTPPTPTQSTATPLDNLESGTLAVSFTFTPSANSVAFRVTADTSLTPTVMGISYFLLIPTSAGVHTEA
jgi:hypothetical protein